MPFMGFLCQFVYSLLNNDRENFQILAEVHQTPSLFLIFIIIIVLTKCINRISAMTRIILKNWIGHHSSYIISSILRSSYVISSSSMHLLDGVLTLSFYMGPGQHTIQFMHTTDRKPVETFRWYAKSNASGFLSMT